MILFTLNDIIYSQRYHLLSKILKKPKKSANLTLAKKFLLQLNIPNFADSKRFFGFLSIIESQRYH